jgi:hypothetical protein
MARLAHQSAKNQPYPNHPLAACVTLPPAFLFTLPDLALAQPLDRNTLESYPYQRCPDQHQTAFLVRKYVYSIRMSA